MITVTGIALLGLTGCATSRQWAEWRSHSSHFASGQHASFSFRNQGAEAERVRTGDLQTAHSESWWGRQLPVAAQQSER
jgi:hypothetical protein